MSGHFHTYARPHVLFEYTAHSTTQASTKVILFIGGLGDTFNSVPYVPILATALPIWRVCHVQLSSSGPGWGMSSLDRDCEEIGVAVKWVQENFRKDGDGDVDVVLVGHSTGCQDVLHYLHTAKEGRPKVQGAILQAPVSDRDFLMGKLAQDPEKKAIYEMCVRFADSLDDGEREDMIIPLPWSEETVGFDRTPVSVARFLSLASPESPERPGPDDLFSFDATKVRLQETFGAVGKSAAFQVSAMSQYKKPSMLIGMMGADEYVPEHVDPDISLMRWKKAIEEGGALLDEASGIVPGGKHNLKGRDGERKEARNKFVEMVKGYLGRVSQDREREASLGAEERLPHRPSLSSL